VGSRAWRTPFSPCCSACLCSIGRTKARATSFTRSKHLRGSEARNRSLASLAPLLHRLAFHTLASLTSPILSPLSLLSLLSLFSLFSLLSPLSPLSLLSLFKGNTHPLVTDRTERPYHSWPRFFGSSRYTPGSAERGVATIAVVFRIVFHDKAEKASCYSV